MLCSSFSRSTSELDLIARKIIYENEGDEGSKYLEEYSDGNTERGKYLRGEICRRLKLTSIDFQSLAGTVKAVGLPEEKLTPAIIRRTLMDLHFNLVDLPKRRF